MRQRLNWLGEISRLPKTSARTVRDDEGGVHDGPVDALLIAGYGLRKLGGTARKPPKAFDPIGDFF